LQQLLQQLGRLERSLIGMAPARVDAPLVRAWIRRAQEQQQRLEGGGRSRN
jgi:hypothetical protein